MMNQATPTPAQPIHIESLGAVCKYERILMGLRCDGGIKTDVKRPHAHTHTLIRDTPQMNTHYTNRTSLACIKWRPWFVAIWSSCEQIFCRWFQGIGTFNLCSRICFLPSPANIFGSWHFRHHPNQFGSDSSHVAHNIHHYALTFLHGLTFG